MRFVICLILLAIALELVTFGLPLLWRWRRAAVYCLAIIVAFSSTALLVARFNVFSGLFFIASLYRMLNFQRVIEARMHEAYLRRAVCRTSWSLLAFQVLDLLVWLGWAQMSGDVAAKHVALICLVAVQALVAVILLISTIRNMAKTRPTEPEILTSNQLPTLSVCIPARNETDDLQECLETVLASDYPKLEVLVLDDCSTNKRTPEIIRQFAHDGVEFVPGSMPPEHWLAKNWAYDKLLEAANGELVLFCGVDVRLAPTTLHKMVSELQAGHKTMLSVVPERLDAHHKAIIQPMRYWWELVLPRNAAKHPPVLSTCWLAKRSALQKAGGLAASTRMIVPEAYFARQFSAEGGYTFIRSSDVLGVTTDKKSSEQRATAVRTRYPQLHRRPELVMLLSLAELILLVLPFGLAIGGWWLSSLTFPILAVIASVLLVISYEILITATMPRNTPLATISFPFVVLVDMWLLNYSMYKYEFSSVDWKGRNVCIPAMHITPSLGSE